MKTRFSRYLFKHRTVPKRVIATVFPSPVLLKLDEFQMYVRLDDWAVGARIAVNRGYEKHVTREIKHFLTPGVVLVDVGANIGYYTLVAASSLGDTGKIIAFEPSPENCSLLKMSVEKNGFRNVKVYTKAVADISGVVGLKMDDSNGMIHKEHLDACTYQVEAVTLDDVLRNESRIDVIKMDIEGAEGLVIQGAEQIIQLHRPVIFTEFRPPALERRSNMAAEDFLNRFRRFRYELRVIDKKHGASRLPQSNQEIQACYEQVKPSHIDLLAVPR